jgi:hypothetical protein
MTVICNTLINIYIYIYMNNKPIRILLKIKNQIGEFTHI